jgi:Helix-turn-helix domain
MAQSRIPNRLRADGAHDAESASQNFRFINPHRLFHGVWLPQWLEERPEVSEKAKKLYSYLTYFAGGKGYAWPSFNHLAEKLHVSRRYVIKLVQELSAHRLITVTNVNRPCKGHCTNYYRFLWHPWMQHSDDGNFCMTVREEPPPFSTTKSDLFSAAPSEPQITTPGEQEFTSPSELEITSPGEPQITPLVQCILESGYALAMIAGWHPNV